MRPLMILVLMLTWSCHDQGKNTEADMSVRAFAPAADGSLRFRLPPGTKQLALMSNATQKSGMSFEQTMHRFGYRYQYTLAQDDGKVLMSGAWTVEAQQSLFSTEKPDDVAFRYRLTDGDENKTVFDTNKLTLSLSEPSSAALTLTIATGQKPAPIDNILFRVSARTEMPRYRRRLAWARLAPELKEMTAAMPRSWLSTLGGKDILGLMRWHSDPRAPQGVAAHDFHEYRLTPLPFEEKALGKYIPFDERNLLTSSLWRVFEWKGVADRDLSLCAQSVSGQGVNIKVVHYHHRFAEPSLLETLKVGGAARSYRVHVKSGEIALTADGPAYAFFEGEHGCVTPRVSPVKDTAYLTPAFHLPAQRQVLIPVHGPSGDNASPLYRLEVFVADKGARAEKNGDVRIAWDMIDRHGKSRWHETQTLGRIFSPYLRLMDGTASMGISKPLTRIFVVPPDVTHIIMESSADVLMTSAVHKTQKAPLHQVVNAEEMLPPEQVLAQSAWWPIQPTFSGQRHGQQPMREATLMRQMEMRMDDRNPQRPNVTLMSRGAEETSGKPGQVFLEATAWETDSPADLATAFAKFPPPHISVPVTMARTAWLSGPHVIYHRASDKPARLKVLVDQNCVWEGALGGASGDIQLPPLPAATASQTHAWHMVADDATTFWVEGVHPSTTTPDRFRKKFFYILEKGADLTFQFDRPGRMEDQNIVLQFMPKKGKLSDTSPVIEVALDQDVPMRRRQGLDDWTVRRRRYRLSDSSPESSLVDVANDQPVRQVSPSFVFPLGKDLDAGPQRLHVRLLDGGDGFLAISTSYPWPMDAGPLRVSFDNIHLTTPAASCRL